MVIFKPISYNVAEKEGEGGRVGSEHVATKIMTTLTLTGIKELNY